MIHNIETANPGLLDARVGCLGECFMIPGGFQPERSPEQLLFFNILVSDVCEASNGFNGRDCRVITREAKNWLLSDSTSHITDFVSLCDLLNFDPRKLRGLALTKKLTMSMFRHLNGRRTKVRGNTVGMAA